MSALYVYLYIIHEKTNVICVSFVFQFLIRLLTTASLFADNI